MKNPKALALAIALGMMAAMMQQCAISKRESDLLFQGELLTTLVAAQDIPKNFKLDETMVRIEKIPRKWRQPGAYDKVEDVLGQLAATGIRKDEQVLATKIVSPQDAGLAVMVPKKKRGIAIAVYDVNAVGGHVKPNNYVDILGSFDFGSGDKADLRTITLFQNVQVLAVGDDIGINLAQNGEEDKDAAFRRATSRNNGTVVVALTPLDCQKVTLAQEMGALSLTLRSTYEEQRFVELEKTSIHTAIGIPKKVRYQRRASYRTIREGSF